MQKQVLWAAGGPGAQVPLWQPLQNLQQLLLRLRGALLEDKWVPLLTDDVMHADRADVKFGSVGFISKYLFEGFKGLQAINKNIRKLKKENGICSELVVWQ